MFADRAKIIIRSGKGGDGHVSFRRELYVPNGGPDGGDGGRGGDVIFEVDEGQNTLGEYRHKHKFKAQDGQEGGKKRCHGANVICDGSPSRIRMVRRISLGMTTRPRSSIRRTIPVAFIYNFLQSKQNLQR